MAKRAALIFALMLIIADSSCLIALHNISRLNLLHQLFGSVAVTPEVAAEFGIELPQWISVQAVSNQALFEELTTKVDRGEASAIALAIEHPASLLVIDEEKGRKLAKRYAVRHTGTLGLIGLAKTNGLIETVQPLLTELKNVGFRVSEELETYFLQLYNEA